MENALKRLGGKRALVTAAGAGIGRACAERFTMEGAEVVATDISPSALNQLDDSIGTQVLDVTDSEMVESIAAHHDPFDILVSAAGIVPHGTILDCPPQEWRQAVELNLTAMYSVIRAFLPKMIGAGGGSIITISSVASSISGVPNRCAYGASKAGVIGLTKAVAADHVAQGIRANAICPGTVESPSLAARMEATGDAEAARAEFVARQPMGRLGKPAEIAALATYLGSDEAAFTTGAVHVVDGGWTN